MSDRPDTEARLHEQTLALWNMLNASLRAESLSSKALDLILAALRRVDEEARRELGEANEALAACQAQAAGAIAAARAEGERAGFERAANAIRALWPHIEIPAGKHVLDRSVIDPGPMTCLRCKIEEALK